MPIPNTENPLVLRTDFTDDAVWDKVCNQVRKPVGLLRFRANVEFLDDPTYDRMSIEAIIGQIPKNYQHTFIFLVDQQTIESKDHPLLVVDLFNQPGHSFRALPRQIQGIENNLSIANMDFEEFADNTDDDGVFRGFGISNRS